METTFIAETDYLSMSSLLIYFSSYYILERIGRKVLHHVSPNLYKHLQAEQTLVRYLTFAIGVFVTLIATPICLQALQESSSDNDVLGQPQKSSPAGQVCLASRGVLWISELNRLDYSNGYVVHHLSSLGYLLYQLQFRLPLRPIYAIYASLFTELFSDLACMLVYQGLKADTSSLAYRVRVINTLSLLFLRVPPIVYAASFLGEYTLSNPLLWMNIISLFLYTRFIFNIARSDLSTLKILTFISEKPAHLLLFQRYKLPLYGLFFSAASFTTAILTTFIFSHTSPKAPLENSNTFQLSLQLLSAGLIALAGARIPAIIAENGSHRQVSSKLFARSGFWLQGAMLAGALGVNFIPFIEDPSDRTHLLASLALVFPLGEAIGRIGCHYAGCCGRVALSSKNASHKDKVFKEKQDHNHTFTSPQLLTTLLNTLTTTTLIATVLTQTLPLSTASTLSLLFQSAIRLTLSPLRQTPPPKTTNPKPLSLLRSPTNIFAILQLISTLIIILAPSLYSGVTLNAFQNGESYIPATPISTPSSGIQDQGFTTTTSAGAGTGSMKEAMRLASEEIGGLVRSPWIGMLLVGSLVPSGILQGCGTGSG
ncbi:MAG: hypothetical protein M1834_003230 [Cirrosporium novae-zelandiae]|nr:MAG: hypothetical protein M1834_003230 [Cirrosporium novae-zelandiae]